MDILRRCVFRPYIRGKEHPVFSLTTYFVPTRASTGQQHVGYVFRMNGKVLFKGEDFGCSPCHALDSDEAVASLMGFLTLKPGDTDAEYFEKYTEEQLEYCADHAEALSCYIEDRFGGV